jgi:hypothetical protein
MPQIHKSTKWHKRLKYKLLSFSEIWCLPVRQTGLRYLVANATFRSGLNK